MVVESLAYGEALRVKLLGGPLDVDQVETLELGRTEAGYPRGRYPLPVSFCDTADDVVVGIAMEPAGAVEHGTRRDQYDPRVSDQVADTGYRCARAVHTFPLG